MLVAGDAAAMCLAAGIWLEGVNFAMASGMYAGQAAAEALRRKDTSAKGLAGYTQRLEGSFVLQDHRKLRRAPHLVLGELSQQHLPGLACGIAERMFHVDNPRPKPGLRRIVQSEMKRSGVKLKDVAKDTWTAVRSFG
jgi:electron transfer flavoprotein-quinone oxidoreductase